MKKYYVDIIFCLVIIPMVLMIAPIDKWMIYQMEFPVILIIYLYTVYFIFRRFHIMSMFTKKDWWKAIMLIAVLFFATELISMYPLPSETMAGPNMATVETRVNIRHQAVWFFFLVVTGFSLCINANIELFQQIILKKEMEVEKNKAELDLYKRQINPHFLFNTLNAIYALILTKSDDAETAFVKFSDLFKYAYTYTRKDSIQLDEELKYIKQYIDLQKLRLNDHTAIQYIENIDDGNIPIPPMILITFVENAFKYGASSLRDCYIKISVRQKDDLLVLDTENLVMKESKETDSAVGIENCRKRLDMLYPQNYKLSVQNIDGTFFTHLEIKLV